MEMSLVASAVGTQEQWLTALSLLSSMEDALLSPNVISYNSAAGAAHVWWVEGREMELLPQLHS